MKFPETGISATFCPRGLSVLCDVSMVADPAGVTTRKRRDFAWAVRMIAARAVRDPRRPIDGKACVCAQAHRAATPRQFVPMDETIVFALQQRRAQKCA